MEVLRSLRSHARDWVAALLLHSRWTQLDRALRERTAIVTFHRVLPEELRGEYPLPGLAVTPEELAWLLAFFKEHFECGSLAETLDGSQGELAPAREGAQRPRLAVTFDDGMRDNFEHARPVLAAAGVHATFFVPVDAIESGEPLWHDRMAYVARAFMRRASPEDQRFLEEAVGAARLDAEGFVERTKLWSPEERSRFLEQAEERVGRALPSWEGLMSYAELRALLEEGHEIGSHSLSHALLPQCDDEQLERELVESRRVLSERLGAPIDSFCYPNGDHDERVVSATKKAGYRSAVTTRFGSNPRGADLWTLRRYDMHPAHARDAGGQLSKARLSWRLSGLHPGVG